MKDIKNDQTGVVSLIVTMVLMIVVTIIVLSFAKLSRQESQNALDRELSTQAFYAAESGVNYAKSYIPRFLATSPSNLIYNSDCNGSNSFAAALHSAVPSASATLPNLAGNGNASVTCLFVSLVSPTIVFGPPADMNQHIFPIDYNGSPLGKINVNWKNPLGNTVGCNGLSTSTNPSSIGSGCAGVLRIELVNATDLTTSKVYFVYPGSGGSLSSSTPSGSKVSASNCSNGDCNISIDLSGSNKYYARVQSLYVKSTITVSSTPGNNFYGAQAVIDATGKAADVLRRVQVRTSISGLDQNVPAFGLQAGNICKQFYYDGTTATGVACPY